MSTQDKSDIQKEADEFRRKQDIIIAALWETGVEDWGEAVKLLASTLNIISMQRDFIALTSLRHVRSWFSEGGKN